MAQDGKNVEATGTEVDTPATQPCSLDVRAHIDALRALGEKHSGNSLIRHICETLPTQLRNFSDRATLAWASHETQPLGSKIKWQLDQLEAALRASRAALQGR